MSEQGSRRPRRTANDNASGAAAPAPPSHDSLIDLINLQWRRERPDLDLSNFLLAIYFMRLGTLVDRAYDRMCQKRYGISGSDMRVLLALRRGGHPYFKRPTDLFRALLVTSGAITKKVDRLVSHGLVERLMDPGNNAGFLIHLTRKGLQVVDEATETLARESVIAPAMFQFTGDERDAGARFAIRTLAALEASGIGNEDEDDTPADATADPARPRARRRAKP
jgi:DNA-binding MarR family transcriptional regulator